MKLSKIIIFITLISALHAQADDQDLLYDAIKSKQSQSAIQLIQSGIDLNFEFQYSPLILAMQTQQVDVFTELLKQGADINTRYSFPVSAIAFSLHQSDDQYLKLILTFSKNADVDQADPNDYGHTLLMKAGLLGDISKFEILLAHGADLSKPDNFKDQVLGVVAYKGQVDMVKHILTKEVDIHHKNRRGNTALNHATSQGHLDIVNLLEAKLAENKQNALSPHNFQDIEHQGTFAPFKPDHIQVDKQGKILASAPSTKGMFLSFWEGDSNEYPIAESVGIVGFEFNSQGDLIMADFVAGSVLKRDSKGNVSVLADQLNRVTGLAINSKDEVFAAMFNGSNNHSIVQIFPDGTIKKVAKKIQVRGVIGLIFDDSDNLYAGSWDSGTIYKITPKGKISVFSKIPNIQGNGINQITYGQGFLYTSAGTPRKLYRIDASTGEVETVTAKLLGLNEDANQDLLTDLSGAITLSNDGKTLYYTNAQQALVKLSVGDKD
ncbi:ankyrin repeat domain-containing protein [Marinicellulosiphila megalodicopiae]|uniref:ankyrin repeat domain-containing protein n=1 Tax=Marinicellulosiphila megalodicopiae TaxID=2724896 RepID=UPI003BB04F4B